MIYLQTLVTLFVISVLYRLFRQWQQRQMTIASFLVWLFLWLVVLVIFWQPEIASYLANRLGVGRGADLIIYLSIVTIFYLLFKILIRLNKIEKDITKIVRQDALKDEHEKR